MKRLVTMLAALSMVAPSVAFAEPAAKALSLNNAATQPLRATTPIGKKLNADDDNQVIWIIGGILVIGGIICLIACDGGDSN